MLSWMMRDPEWCVLRAKVLLANAATAVPDLKLEVELASTSSWLKLLLKLLSRSFCRDSDLDIPAPSAPRDRIDRDFFLLTEQKAPPDCPAAKLLLSY